jgi:hypothetical protein
MRKNGNNEQYKQVLHPLSWGQVPKPNPYLAGSAEPETPDFATAAGRSEGALFTLPLDQALQKTCSDGGSGSSSGGGGSSSSSES